MSTCGHLALFIVLSVVLGVAHAKGHPSRPIRFVVPLAAGSTAALGQPVIIDNRVGAGGTIAMDYVARAVPDGYTIALATSAAWGINPTLYKLKNHDPLKEFVPVTYLASSSNVIVVSPSSNVKTLAELIKSMRDAPGKKTFSSGGNGTTYHFSSALLNAQTSTSAIHIPCSGAPQGVTAVMANEVNLGIYNTPSVIGQINGGKLRARADTGTARSPLLPELATVRESGLPNYVVSLEFGVFTPIGTQPAVVTRIHDELEKIMAAPDVVRMLTVQGFESFRATGAVDFGASMRPDVNLWGSLVRASNATVDRCCVKGNRQRLPSPFGKPEVFVMLRLRTVEPFRGSSSWQ